MNIASHFIPPVPVDALSSAPGDRAVIWKWGLFIFYKDPSGRRRHYFELSEETARRSEATG